MKKINLLLTLTFCLVLFSCRNAENKADRDEPADTINTKPEEKTTDTNYAPSGTTRGLDIGSEPDDILINIDNHLISKVSFTSAGADGGITNAVLTVENILPDATFQKALVDVTILLADGKVFRTDYYTVQNLEPGGKKTVKIPNTTRGTSVTSHVVKAKSAELTKGEMILVGSHYVRN